MQGEAELNSFVSGRGSRDRVPAAAFPPEKADRPNPEGLSLSVSRRRWRASSTHVKATLARLLDQQGDQRM